MRRRRLVAATLVMFLPALSGCAGLFVAEMAGMAVSGAIGDPTADLGHRSLTWAPTAAALRRAYARAGDGSSLRWSSGVVSTAGGTVAEPVAVAGLDLPAWTIRYKPRAVIDAANVAVLPAGKEDMGRCRAPVDVKVTLSGLQWDLVSLQVSPGHIRRWIPVARVDIDVVARAAGKPLLHDHYAARASGSVHDERARLKAVPPILDAALANAYRKAMAGVDRALHGGEGAICASG